MNTSILYWPVLTCIGVHFEKKYVNTLYAIHDTQYTQYMIHNTRYGFTWSPRAAAALNQLSDHGRAQCDGGDPTRQTGMVASWLAQVELP